MALNIKSALKADVGMTVILYKRSGTGFVDSALDIVFLNLDKELLALPIVKELESQAGINITYLKGRAAVMLSTGIDGLKLADILIAAMKEAGCSTIKSVMTRDLEGECSAGKKGYKFNEPTNVDDANNGDI